MENNKRPESMQRINTPELAQAFIAEQVEAIRKEDLKAFFRDNTIMPELSGLKAQDICEIVNAAIPEMGKQYTLTGKQVQVKHIYKWKSEALKYPSDDDKGRPYYQEKINRIRAEAQRRINK